MKIRTGFLSNSSSSSFCLYGAYLDRNKVNELMKSLTNGETAWEWKNDFRKMVCDLGLEFETGNPNGGEYYFYVGRSYENIGMDETKRQMMDDVDKKMKLLFEKIGYTDNEPLSTQSDAWYDG